MYVFVMCGRIHMDYEDGSEELLGDDWHLEVR